MKHSKCSQQCSHKVRFSRTLVRNRTFWSKLVRERSDFALKSPILKAWVNINLSIVQYCFQTVVQLSAISESVHIPSSKLIFTGMNTNYLAPSRGARLCLKSCFKAIIKPWSDFYQFLSHLGPILVWFQWKYWSDLGPILASNGPLSYVVSLLKVS